MSPVHFYEICIGSLGMSLCEMRNGSPRDCLSSQGPWRLPAGIRSDTERAAQSLIYGYAHGCI